MIASIVDAMFSLLQADSRFIRFATGRSIDSHKRAWQLIVDQLCALSGGPCFYIGRDMKTSHTGLRITDSEWNANLELTRQAIEKNGIRGQEEAELLSMFERYRADVVEARTATLTFILKVLLIDRKLFVSLTHFLRCMLVAA